VLRGRASCRGRQVSNSTRQPRTSVAVRPGLNRTAFEEEPGTTIVAAGGVPGKPYEPGSRKLFAPLRPLYEAGNYAEAANLAAILVFGEPMGSGPGSAKRSRSRREIWAEGAALCWFAAGRAASSARLGRTVWANWAPGRTSAARTRLRHHCRRRACQPRFDSTSSAVLTQPGGSLVYCSPYGVRFV
jgi:hypothetical protein